MWKVLFVGITSAVLYFSYGVAQHGGILGFIAGVVVGAIIMHLFQRYKHEVASNINANSNTQNVQVNLTNQNRVTSGLPFHEEVEEILDEKLDALLSDPQALERLLAESKRQAMQRELRKLVADNRK